ncbi:MAG TPA: site-2 protease family protein [Isosphaeraceae bacterium]
MFGVPGPTEFDVRFRLFGVPVRIHPLFWAMAAMLGWNLTEGSGKLLLVWVGCVFFSILVHEFGHALTARMFGAEPSVVLYTFGGLCVYQNPQEDLRRRLLVLIMGPGAGFLLMGATILAASVAFKTSPLDIWNGHILVRGVSPLVALATYFLIEINLFWGILNLLPIMPLDGGQIAMVLLTMHNRSQGLRRAYIVSLVTAGLVAIYFIRSEQYINALLFGYLGLMSYQNLQALHYQSRYGSGFEDEVDWWKR